MSSFKYLPNKIIDFRILNAAGLQINPKHKINTRNTLTDKFSHLESIGGFIMSSFKYLPDKKK